MHAVAADGRRDAWRAYLLNFGGLALAALTGWLGGELVDRLGVGVDPGANRNAPNSLSGVRADSARSELG